MCSLEDHLKPQDQMSVSVYLAVKVEYIAAEMVKLDDSATKKQEHLCHDTIYQMV